MNLAASEALRITRSLELTFATGPGKTGSGFVAPAPNRLITCAHVVRNDDGARPKTILVKAGDGKVVTAKLADIDDQTDLATLEIDPGIEPSTATTDEPQIGDSVLFSGLPQGLSRISVFPGIISNVGPIPGAHVRCDLLQIAGMINNGNSGGPVLNDQGKLIGVVSAKYVPLLVEIDKLRAFLKNMPQFPSEVGIGGIDFSKFVNLMVQCNLQLAQVLRLVQVGTGWAVPAKYFPKVGGC